MTHVIAMVSCVDFPWTKGSLTEDLTFFSVLLRSGLHVLRRWRSTELRVWWCKSDKEGTGMTIAITLSVVSYLRKFNLWYLMAAVNGDIYTTYTTWGWTQVQSDWIFEPTSAFICQRSLTAFLRSCKVSDIFMNAIEEITVKISADAARCSDGKLGRSGETLATRFWGKCFQKRSRRYMDAGHWSMHRSYYNILHAVYIVIYGIRFPFMLCRARSLLTG